MYVCMHVCVCVYIYMYICIYIYIYMHASIYVYIYIYIYISFIHKNVMLNSCMREGARFWKKPQTPCVRYPCHDFA